MASRGKKDAAFSALRNLMNTPGSYNDIWGDVLKGIEPDPKKKIARILDHPNYDDRAAAIVFTSMLEQMLEFALTTHFPHADSTLFSYPDDGPFSEFSAKIKIGHALGIYCSRMQADLTRVKNIRNAFAHARILVSFETPAISMNCDLLKIAAKSIEVGIGGGEIKTARQKFTTAVAMLCHILQVYCQKPFKYSDWHVYNGFYPPEPLPEKPPPTDRQGPQSDDR
jgi:hypothetical protein